MKTRCGTPVNRTSTNSRSGCRWHRRPAKKQSTAAPTPIWRSEYCNGRQENLRCTRFDRLIAGPLRIRDYGWGTDPAGNPYGGGGAHFLPRDFMKIGQLMAQ